MEEGTDEEHDSRSTELAITHVNERYVDVTDAPSVHRHIPCSPKRVHIVGIPPVTVKVSVRKMHNFTDEVEQRMECQVEHAQPYKMIGNLKNIKLKNSLKFPKVLNLKIFKLLKFLILNLQQVSAVSRSPS